MEGRVEENVTRQGADLAGLSNARGGVMDDATYQLRRFERIALEPGQSKTVSFALSPEQLTFVAPNLKRVLEPGTFEVMIGKSAQDIALKGNFELVK